MEFNHEADEIYSFYLVVVSRRGGWCLHRVCELFDPSIAYCLNTTPFSYMIIYLRQTPSIKLPFGSDCWDCRYVCRHPAGYSDWVRASLRFTNKFLNIANKNSPPKTKACSISCCMMYSCQSSVWFFATRGWLSDLSSLGNARKDASNGSIQNASIQERWASFWCLMDNNWVFIILKLKVIN